MTQVIPTGLRLALVPDHHGHIVDIEREGIAKKRQQQQGQRDGNGQTQRVPKDVKKLLPMYTYEEAKARCVKQGGADFAPCFGCT